MKNLGQIFICGIKKDSLEKEEKKWIKENNIGGICLFKRNIKSRKQVKELNAEIISLNKKNPPLIYVDMEGGRVNRFSHLKKYPSFLEMTKKDKVYETYFKMSLFLKSLNIHVNFSPVCDVLKNKKNKIIGNRSPSTCPKKTSFYAQKALNAILDGNMLSCLKHFPGHGKVSVDSHKDLPIDRSSKEYLFKNHLYPFAENLNSPFIMSAHILYPKLDPKNPASFSKKIIGILKNKYKYKGLIISDDLDMKALTSYHEKKSIPLKALRAGIDLLLYCNDFNSQENALTHVRKNINKSLKDQTQKSIKKLLKLKKSYFK